MPPPGSFPVSLKSSLYAVLPDFALGYAERIEASPVGYRLARGAFWSLAGAVISRGLALISSVLVARILGKVGFGELGIVQTTVGMFGAFAGFGLGLTSTKYVAEFRATDPARAGRIMALSVVVAVVTGAVATVALLVLAPWLAEHTLAAPHLAGVLRIGGGMLFLGAVTGAQSGALAGFEAFKTIAVVNFASGLVTFPLLVGGTILGGLKGAVWALVGSMGVNWLLNHVSLRRESALAGVPFRLSGWGREWPTLWKFSLPAALSGVIVAPIYWVTNSILVNRPNGYAEMGIFNAANQWFGALLFLPAVLGQVVLPALSERLGDEDRIRAAKMVSLSIKLNLLVVTPLVLILCLASPWVMGFYGHSFRAGWPTFVIVVVTADLLAVQLPVSQLIAAAGRMWLGFSMNLGWALVFVLGTAAWVSNGATGLAAARLTAYAMLSLWTFGWARHALKANGVRSLRPS